MLYLHLGTPRTATGSLQRLLSEAAPALRELGYEYPERWTSERPPAHHPLALEVAGDGGDSALRDELMQHLRRAETANVIVSSEVFTNALAGASFPAFRDFLVECSIIGGVKLIISLRRLDAMVASMYLYELRAGGEPEPIDAYAGRRFAWVDTLFANLGRLADERWTLATIPYREGCEALGRLLAEMDLDLATLGPAPTRVGVTPGLKAQALLGSLRSFADDVDAPRLELIDLFNDREFEFRDESRTYDVLGYATRRELHEHALAKAAAHGIRTYTEAFADDRIVPMERADVDGSALGPGDLEDLREHLRAGSEARR